MKRWIARAAAIYPKSWREQYGAEFDALLDDVTPNWRVLMNVLGGAITMQIRTGSNEIKLVAATVALCAMVTGGASFAVPPSYVSSAVISVSSQPDPVRPTSTLALQQRAAMRFETPTASVLSRPNLHRIINLPSLDLYKAERKRNPDYNPKDLICPILRWRRCRPPAMPQPL